MVSNFHFDIGIVVEEESKGQASPAKMTTEEESKNVDSLSLVDQPASRKAFNIGTHNTNFTVQTPML